MSYIFQNILYLFTEDNPEIPQKNGKPLVSFS